MTLPRLTVITPSLNQVDYLERTLRSVLDQEYPDLEYIVMDGGSTDGSVDVLRSYDDRLAYWVSEPDEGQSWAINRAIERATGEVIAYINSDDFYLPGAFEAALPLFDDPAVRWVVGACEIREADGYAALTVPTLPVGRRASWIRSTWYAPQASSFWRRDVFEEFGLLRDDLSFVFDTEFGLRLVLAGVQPLPIERPLAVRYLHDEAKSAERTRFDREFKRKAARGLRRQLSWPERAGDIAIRSSHAVLHAQYVVRRRFGLLHLRERWFGGRFARS
jgi:glycosyltransferase involved in cell wall biosynthesis